MKNILECIICKRIGIHKTVHLSELLDIKFKNPVSNEFKWRVYWTDEDWGSYIADEAGQTFDFWKEDEMNEKLGARLTEGIDL